MDVDQLNIEIGVFLKRLRMHSERQNAQINEKTAELLLEAILHIDKLIANAEMIPTTQQDCVKFLFDLNDKQFDLRQYIMCRLCVEQIGLSKEDLEAHLQRNIHTHKPQQRVDYNGVKVIAVEQVHPEPKAINETNGAKDMVLHSGYKDPGAVANDDNGRLTVDNIPKDSVVDSATGFTTGSYIKVDKTTSIGKGAGGGSEATKPSERSSPFSFDSTYLIKASKIPWVASKQEILEFFNDVNILNGVRGIHFIVDKTINSCNEAFIQLASEEDYQLALNLKMIRMGFSYVKISQANMIEFMFLISKPSYPAEQRVLRIENLPQNCSTMEIKKYFEGRTILKVHVVLDVSKRQTGEAFVMFANIDEMELALQRMEGRKIRNTLIRSFRSSEEQLRYYCDTVAAVASNNSQAVPSSMQTRVNSVPNLSPQKKAIYSSTASLKMDGGMYRILARGFPWHVRPEHVTTFFQNVSIVGGISGIHISKNVAMEATFFVNSKEDLNKALSRDKFRFDSRSIHDKINNFIDKAKLRQRKEAKRRKYLYCC